MFNTLIWYYVTFCTIIYGLQYVVLIQVVLCNCLTSISLAGFAPLALSKASPFPDGELKEGTVYLNVKQNTLVSNWRYLQ